MSFDIHVSGPVRQTVAQTVPALVADLVASGITAQDPTLWGPAVQDDAAQNLGWVQAVSVSRDLVDDVGRLRAELAAQGLDRIVLAGMGGSSRGADVIARTAGAPLTVLDGTAPGQVRAALGSDDDLARTVAVISSKSGTTIETDAFRRAFEAAYRDAGIDPAQRVVVVTDPGSPLEAEARASGYRVFLADPTVCGCYSALTAYGLVPAGLAGVDLGELLDEADATLLEVAIDSPDNPALVLAAALGGAGRGDKLALVSDGTHVDGIDAWVEQLLAESTGKLGTGILPVVLLPVSPELDSRPSDLQVLRFVDDATGHRFFSRHEGEVLISGSLGAQLVVWEYAAAIIARMLGVSPFEQPDVLASKAAAAGHLQQVPAPPAFSADGVEVRTGDPGLAAPGTISGVLDALWSRLGPDGYVSVQAYTDPLRVAELAGLRELVAADAGRPTTFGWGPRLLHSTGQYHKGGPATGVFLQITERAADDLPVPGRPYTFGGLTAALAAGDAAVLADHGRPVVVLTLADPAADLRSLFEAAQ